MLTKSLQVFIIYTTLGKLLISSLKDASLYVYEGFQNTNFSVLLFSQSLGIHP